eukprot:TRINITY_DN8117_c0_g1_i2.p1 TRINITY_DN8117_c0_g1~~TRINITY_DN8117_c0_g1_i2.p1  ORF type:complete len:536 (+),score=185.28 TRINITY_DN8117_c0_g1_i2:145-1752(+)
MVIKAMIPKAEMDEEATDGLEETLEEMPAEEEAPAEEDAEQPASKKRKQKKKQQSAWSQGQDYGSGDNSGIDDGLAHRIHESVYKTVWEAVQPVRHLENQWSPDEMVKRLTRYITKASNNPALAMMPLEQLCKTLVESAFMGYSTACNEKDWFYDVDLVPAFCSSAFEILIHHRRRHEVDLLEEVMQLSFEEGLEKVLLERAMWDCIKGVFGTFDEKVQGKVYKALSGAYWTTLDDVLQHHFRPGGSPEMELKCVETFMQQWIEAMLQRGWQAMDPPEALWTSEAVTDLFSLLVSPFGEDSGFSCVPGVLVETIEYPPANWPFVEQAVADTFASYESGAKKKKKRTASGPTTSLETYNFTPKQNMFKSVVFGGQRHGAGGKGAQGRGAFAQQAPQRGGQWQKGGKGGWGAGSPQQAAPQIRAATSRPTQQPKAKMAPAPKATKPAASQMKPRAKAGSLPGSVGAAAKAAAKAGSGFGQGHSECRSEEDCIGSPQSRLVQHVVPDNPDGGDCYCEPCWCTFVRRNPDLEGSYLDEA